MRLIDADALEKYKVTGEVGNLSGDFIPGFAIGNAPTIEVEPVRPGRWEKICTSSWRWKHDGAHVVNRVKFKHNDCGKVVAKAEPYCPNCGAKMDLEE